MNSHALDLAEELETMFMETPPECEEAAAELRRLSQVETEYRERILRLEAALAKANSQAEHFEREWYLRGDQVEDLLAALQAYVDASAMSPYGDYSKIKWESQQGPINPTWGGGDCKKHGRWYGHCHSCAHEWEKLRERADFDARWARDAALRQADQQARTLVANTASEIERKQHD